MDRFSGAGYVTVGGARQFVDLNLLTSTPGSYPNALWFNGAQESILAPSLALGIIPSDADNTQLLRSILTIGSAHVTQIASSGVVTSATLSLFQSGLVIINAAGGNLTLSLPTAGLTAGSSIAYEIVRSDSTANSLTITAAGGQTIQLPGGSVGSIGLLALGHLTLRNDTGTVWTATGAEGLTSNGRGTAPAVATSAQGIYLGAGYSGSVSVTSTPKDNGWIMGFGGINHGIAGSAFVSGALNIGGTLMQSDNTTVSKSHIGVLAVIAGVPVTTTYYVTTAADPGIQATYHAGHIFLSNGR